MDPDRQKYFQGLLLDRLLEVEEELASKEKEGRQAVSPDVSIGRLSRLDSMQMQEMALAADRRLKSEMKDLEEAMTRLASGKYGICEVCRKPIPEERLIAMPTATCCVKCLS